MDIQRTKFSRSTGYGLFSKEDGIYQQVDGSVETRHGYVRVYSERGPNWRVTSLMMTIDGNSYRTRMDKFYTARGCVTLAARFAEQCSKGYHNG